MRGLLTLGGIAILSAAAWTATLVAADPPQGAVPGSQRPGGFEGNLGRAQPPRAMTPSGPAGSSRYIRYHTEPMGSGGIILYQLQIQPSLFPGQPEMGPAPPGMPSGSSDHPIAAQSVVPAIHFLSPGASTVEAESAHPRPEIAGAAGADQDGGAMAQPNPAASPSTPRPPGTRGPGRPVSGWFGPGRPGPGRSARAG
jgi:hypothetical protein